MYAYIRVCFCFFLLCVARICNAFKIMLRRNSADCAHQTVPRCWGVILPMWKKFSVAPDEAASSLTDSSDVTSVWKGKNYYRCGVKKKWTYQSSAAPYLPIFPKKPLTSHLWWRSKRPTDLFHRKHFDCSTWWNRPIIKVISNTCVQPARPIQ